MRILFHRASGRYGYLSNFAPYSVLVNGVVWPTAEHCFQAQKFDDAKYREAIRASISPLEAAQMGRDQTKHLRKDWDSIKDGIMSEIVLAKFSQHPSLKSRLLSTANATLVEHTKTDAYWGDGGDGSGKNVLGRILMRVREELRKR
jgi:N-glycosidase YbiA